MEDLINFKRRILKVDGPKNHKIRNSLGVYDAYKYYRKVKPKDKEYILTESQYFSIIRKINNILANQISLGHEVILPCKMGKIELRKYPKTVRIDENGKVQTNLPIDWDRTLELWYNDEESRNNKTLIKEECNEIYKLLYNKSSAQYTNKAYYGFSFNRELKKLLKRNIKDGVTEALLVGKVDYVE